MDPKLHPRRRSAGIVTGRSLLHAYLPPSHPSPPSSSSTPNAATATHPHSHSLEASPPMDPPLSPIHDDDNSSGFSGNPSHHTHQPGSYTANYHSVRESSNRLASFALRGEASEASGGESAFSLGLGDVREEREGEAPGQGPSGLSKVLKSHDTAAMPSRPTSNSFPSALRDDDEISAPVARSLVYERPRPESVLSLTGQASSFLSGKQKQKPKQHISVSERTPLLPEAPQRNSYVAAGDSPGTMLGGMKMSFDEKRRRLTGHFKHLRESRKARRELYWSPIMALPAVLLGVLMNVLDGVSYGMIMFPTHLEVFAGFGGVGVSMFFVSVVVGQLVYTLGGSAFRGGNGSMMVECVPFLHVIAQSIAATIGDSEEDRTTVVATTMVAYALSAVLTGLVFFALGALKLGSLMGFFPRHILVGAIGAVGVFLFLTGLEITARLEGNVNVDLDTLLFFFSRPIVALWTIPLVLAILLRVVTARFSHPFIVPSYFLLIPAIFYIIVFAFHIDIDYLRSAGWIFEVNGVDSGPWDFLGLFEWGKVRWDAVIESIPTQLALVAFGLIHVPINLPSLALSLSLDDLDLDRELIAHGYSNTLAGLCGTIPNYLCYVNSVLFVRVGGDSRVASFLLACATFAIFLVGPWVIGYLPICVVGALIFVLGIDLIKEAVVDTFGRVNRFEYLTIWAIIIASTWSDFVVGLFVGIVFACVSFVVTSSQRRAIRTIVSGATTRSTVRRHPKQSAFLRSVGSQTRILKLQGYLFFGTISACEKTIREILDAAAWSKSPIRFLIFDFGAAVGMDFSAAEAFLRIQRLLRAKGVVFVITGADAEGLVGRALRSVELWAGNEDMRVEVFEHLNEALEHCENAYLRSLYSREGHLLPTIKASAEGLQVPRPDEPLLLGAQDSGVTLSSSPRRMHLRDAATETFMGRWGYEVFQNFLPEANLDFWFKVAPFFESVKLAKGSNLWHAGDEADCFYLIEAGILRAVYCWPPGTGNGPNATPPVHIVQESMMAGTVAGDHSFLACTPRNAEVTVEADVALWKMDRDGWEKLVKNLGPEIRGEVSKGLLRMASEEQEVLIGHLVGYA